jgi:hypothetical protein
MILQALGILAIAGLAYLGYLIYLEVRNQHHWWHDDCVTPDEVRADIRHVLAIFRRVLEGKGITWWLDYGTLLGAWRLGDTLMFDHDLDISFLAEHIPLMEACRAELAAEGVELNLERTSIFYRGRKIGDAEPWTRYGDMLCRNDPAERSGLLRILWPMVDDFPAAWVAPTELIRFDGAFYPCPNRTASLLRRRYLTCRIHLRLAIPHKQRCWLCREFWRQAARIWRSREAPVIVAAEPRE